MKNLSSSLTTVEKFFPGGIGVLASLLLNKFLAIALAPLIEKCREEGGKIAENIESLVNDGLKNAKTGEKLFDDFLVVAVEESRNTIVLEVERSNGDFFGIKIDFIKIQFRMERWINLTKQSKLLEIVGNPTAVFLEATFSRGEVGDSIVITLGGGYDDSVENPSLSYVQYLASAAIDVLDLKLKGLWVNSNNDGFLISLHSRLPTPIPMGPTFTLQGAGLIYGEKMVPRLDGRGKPNNVKEALDESQALDYVKWARKPDVQKWVPVPEDVRVYGISADLGITGLNNLVSLRNASLVYVSYGPSLAFGGELVVAESVVGSAIGALHLPSQTIFFSGSTGVSEAKPEARFIELVGPAIKILGTVESSIDIKYPFRSWAVVGGSQSEQYAKLVFLEVIEMTGGFAVYLSKGVSANAGASIKSEFFGLKISAGIRISGEINYSPWQIAGSLYFHGSVELAGLNIGGEANISLALPKPFKLSLTLSVRISCWLFSITFSIDVFKIDDPTVGLPLVALLPITGTLGVLQRSSALLDKMEDGDWPRVWPDTSLILPFRSFVNVKDMLVVNQRHGDGVELKDGMRTTHEITSIAIYMISALDGETRLVPDLTASWLIRGKGSTERTMQLAVPCNDPIAWLEEYERKNPDSISEREFVLFQDFSEGEIKEFSPPSINFDRLHIRAIDGLELIPIPWATPYARVLQARNLVVHGVYFDLKSFRSLPVRISHYDFRVLAERRRQPVLLVNGVRYQSSAVREFNDDFCEWRVLVPFDLSTEEAEVSIVGSEGYMGILAIGYTASLDSLVKVPPTKIFAPGKYKLVVDGGISLAEYNGRKSEPSTYQLVRNFEVIAPPLRPYIRYYSFGDERGTGIAFGGWNPNPAGMGFPHFSAHQFVVRFRPSYMRQIYSRLYVVFDNGEFEPVDVMDCFDSTPAGSIPSQQWQNSIGLPVGLEQELRWHRDVEPGGHQVKFYYEVNGKYTEIESWNFWVSRYSLPSDLLEVSQHGLANYFGPFGVRAAPGACGLVSNVNDGFAAMNEIDDVDSALAFTSKFKISKLSGNSEASLDFLRIVEMCGVFDAPSSHHKDGVLFRPSKSSISALFGSFATPVGVLFKASEPLDWRRVTIKLYFNGLGYFNTSVLPSSDGTACVIVAMASGVPIHLPSGEYLVHFEFSYAVPGLPSVIEIDSTKNSSFVTAKFVQVEGRAWRS